MKICPKILLAEDNPKDLELTLSALEEYNLANEIVTVNNGAEALDYLFKRGKFHNRATGNPAVIFLDIKMPKVDGIEVLKQIKSHPQLKLIPVVMITSSREEKDILDSYNLGTNAYVVKPINFWEFMNAIKSVGLFWAVINEVKQK